jgi:hypothetical protein
MEEGFDVTFGVKAVISGSVSIFVISAVFWAGATYNRIQGIEAHLGSIDAAVAKIGDLQTIEERQLELQRRIDRLEQRDK